MTDDDRARLLIETALDDTLVVEAAAGTGKTTALVRRMVQVLATGAATIDGMVAVTFTEKAAGELKLRLREALERRRHAGDLEPDARGRLEQALQNLEDAHISTIHGFCADLLRDHPIEASIDPLFTVLTETQARRLFDDAFAGWFQGALEDVPEGVRRSLCRSARPMDGSEPSDADGPVDRLRGAAWSLADWRDFGAGWTRPDFNREAAVDGLLAQVGALARMTAQPSNPKDYFFLDTAAVRRADDDLRLIMQTGDYDAAEAALVDLCRERDFRRARKGFGSAFGTGVLRADVLALHQQVVDQLDGFKADADADLAALLRDELRDVIRAYERLKARHGALDFLDLLLRARDLVRDHDDVRGALQREFTRVFVDEFQDTDPLQAEILLLLAAGDHAQRDWRQVRPAPGKLFIVGDPKQSIYRFRRADVGIYRDVCEQLRRHGALGVHLTRSFRSVPAIQRAVNTAFAPVMTGDADSLQAHYIPLEPSREEMTGQPAVVALPVPRPYGKRNVSGAAIEQSLPDAVGAFIAWLVQDSGWRVADSRTDGRLVPIEAHHICILFRRFVSFGTDITRAYVDAIEARGIRHLLVGGRAFHGREEIESLRAALSAIEWPDDELAVFATLRGALFAIGDEELLEYRHRHAKVFHPFRIPDPLPEHLQPIAEALGVIATLHRRRNRRPVAETVADLFEATRAHVGFALRRAGEQVLANTLHVSELARQYELSGGISFRGFVDELNDAARDGQATEAPIVEEGSDGVRIMTVHKAKGLEFPVVILADLTAKLAPVEASRVLDARSDLCALRIGGWSPVDLIRNQTIEQARERAEGVRLAYVAATRARDLLVVPAVGDQEFRGGWVEPLHSAIYPPLERRRMPDVAPGCPPFRKDSVIERPDEEMASPRTVSPGQHRISAHDAARDAPDERGDVAAYDGGHDVVWWDPAALALGVEPPFGIRRQELISKDVDPGIAAEGLRRYEAWRAARAGAVAQGSIPSQRVQTTTAWAETPDAAGLYRHVEIVTVAHGIDRPAGRRYGTLVHAALGTVAFDADPEAVAAVVHAQSRIVGASEVEERAAGAVVRAMLQHPLLVQAGQVAGSGGCHRETPLTLMQNGELIEGVVDLAFEDGDGMVVIDFKTDRAQGEQLARYVRQVSCYADAIERATGKVARAVLMQV